MKISVFALGRTGLPLSLVCAEAGFEVHGVDINKDLVDMINKGIPPFYEPHMEELLKKHLNKKFFPKTDIDNNVKQSDYLILAIGTKFSKYPERASLTNLYTVIDTLRKMGLKGKTLILRVTLPIGTTDAIKARIEQDGLTEGKDFYLAFVPERLMEGKAIDEERHLPKVVGCYNDNAYEKIQAFFKQVGGDVVRVSNPRTAEFIKLIDNSWRNMRFAFANELAFLSEENQINVMEAIQAANSGYERNAIPIPGPVSGYCLGKDPYLLELAFDKNVVQRGFNSVWFYARRANDWLCQRIVKQVKGETVLVAGLSFKGDIDDFRNSHSFDIIQLLQAEGFSVLVTDPFLDNGPYTMLPQHLETTVTKTKFLEGIAHADTIIIATPHTEYKNADVHMITKKAKKGTTLLDLWNLYSGALDHNNTVNYVALGRGDLQ